MLTFRTFGTPTLKWTNWDWDKLFDAFDTEYSKLPDTNVFYFEVPGLAKDKIEIRVDSGVLTVEGDYTDSINWRKGKKYARREYLSDKLNPDTCKATLQDGLLTISFDIFEEQKPKRITIS